MLGANVFANACGLMTIGQWKREGAENEDQKFYCSVF